ncbi:hypothetical protein F5Y12DRAFT_720298 [Xylaria sp. FL1777]|nr:hypothetical protein F5Y12DRAFT_720298 [Xylaria sp. FL1777]
MAKVQPAKILTIPLGQFGSQGIGEREQAEIVSKLCHFIQPIKPCVNDVDASTTLPSPKASIELRPMLLPAEIILHIFQYLEEPYKLRCYTSNIFPGFIFCMPRVWKHIPTLKICYATRERAIRKYGEPSRRSLPFDPRVDSIDIWPYRVLQSGIWRGETQTNIHHLYTQDYHQTEIRSFMRSIFPRPSYCAFFNEDYEESFDQTNPGIELNRDLLDRIQYAEVEVGCLRLHSRSPYRDIWRDLDLSQWENEWEWVTKHLIGLKNIRELKLNLWQSDTCPAIKAHLKSAGSEGPGYYNREYMSALRAFIKNPDLVERLEVLEVENFRQTLKWSEHTMTRGSFPPWILGDRP